MLYWPEARYIYLSSEVSNVLGYSPQYFTNNFKNFLSVIHDDDLSLVFRMVREMTQYFRNLPHNKRNNVTAAFDYRVKCEDGSYKHILQQVMYLNIDQAGGIIYEIGILVDISRLGKSKPLSLSITNTDGKQLLYYVPENTNSYNMGRFTQRELQIINCLKKGLTSQEISEELYLSHYTVKTHRKNVLKKIGAHNTVELLQYCGSYI